MSDGDGAGRESAPPFVVLEGITKRFPGVVANDDVSLQLHPGEVHALIGENGAGKSTLMRILYGMYPSDSGRIVIKGEEVRIHSPRDAIARGIGMVHQHFVLVDPFTVAENVILGDEGGAILQPEESERKVMELADAYGFQIDPHATVEDLSVGEEQRVEILKALYRGVEILILDEPTAVLTPSETGDLFENLRRLRADGKSIVFISHKLDEVLEIADRITVLRRGAVVGETTPAETSKAKLAEMMVGRPVLFRLEKPEVEIGEPVLRLEGLTGGRLRNLSLDVRAGEIVGVAGVEGNGQRDLADVVMGLRPLDAGRILLDGEDLASRSTAEISNTPRPAAFCSRIWVQTNSIAPTSSPRVGCAASKSFGSVSSSRARINFCWSPPDSAPAVTSMLLARTSNSRTSFRARSLIVRSDRTPNLTNGASSCRPSTRFSQRVIPRTSPCT